MPSFFSLKGNMRLIADDKAILLCRGRVRETKENKREALLGKRTGSLFAYLCFDFDGNIPLEHSPYRTQGILRGFEGGFNLCLR